MKKEMFEMCFEMEDIISIEESGYKNTYDITVSGDHSFILGDGVVSHNSALGGLMPVLGRKECGFYCLKGKPLNAYSADQKKFTANKELSELFQIINHEREYYDLKDGEWFEIEVDGKTYIVNENDNIEINNKWISVKSIINNIG